MSLALVRLSLGLLFLVVISLCPNAFALPPGYTLCAAEGAVCDVSTRTVLVIYGADSGPCVNDTSLTCPGGFSAAITLDHVSPFTCDSLPFGGTDPAFALYKSCFVKDTDGGAPTDPGAGEFNWNSTAHLLQAVLVMGHVFMLWTGFRAGDKV